MTTPNRSSDRLSPVRSETLRELRTQTPDSLAFERATATRTHYFDSKLKLLPGITLPLRSMLVAGDQQQILISPVATSEEAALAGAQPVVLVAPSLLHHRHLETALTRYRPVALWGPPGLAEKKPELMPLHVFGVDSWPYDHVLEYVIVEGAPRRNEVVFFHRATRTIYTADLAFNIREPEGLLAPIAFRAMGVYRRFAVAKMWRRWVTDREAFAASIEDILAWDFDRIVMAHGDPIEHDARGQLAGALRELQLIA